MMKIVTVEAEKFKRIVPGFYRKFDEWVVNDKKHFVFASLLKKFFEHKKSVKSLRK